MRGVGAQAMVQEGVGGGDDFKGEVWGLRLW